VVLAAVVEMQVGRDDGAHLVDGNAVVAQRLIKVVMHRRVELVDEGVADADAGVNEDRASGVQHKVGEHRECRPCPWQVRRRGDVRQVKAMDAGHSGGLTRTMSGA
jgi:hypothetical protein